MAETGDDQIDKIVQRHKTTPIVCKASKRQRDAPSEPAHQSAEIAFNRRTINKRRANDHHFQAGFGGDLAQSLFGLVLGDPIGVLWRGSIVGAKALT